MTLPGYLFLGGCVGWAITELLLVLWGPDERTDLRAAHRGNRVTEYPPLKGISWIDDAQRGELSASSLHRNLSPPPNVIRDGADNAAGEVKSHERLTPADVLALKELGIADGESDLERARR